MKIEDQLEIIRKIDEEAAKYIEETVLPRHKEGSFIPFLEEKGLEIMDLFFWQKPFTTQGQPYWFEIWKQFRMEMDGE